MPEFWDDDGARDGTVDTALADAVRRHDQHFISVLSFSGDREGFALWCATCDGIPSSAFSPPPTLPEPGPNDPRF